MYLSRNFSAAPSPFQVIDGTMGQAAYIKAFPDLAGSPPNVSQKVKKARSEAAEASRKTYLEAASQTEGEAASAPPSGTKRKAAQVAEDAINAHKTYLEDMSVTVTEAEMRVTIKTLFVTACGSPGMEEWKDVGGRQGTVSKIEELLQPTLDNPWAFQKPPDRRTIEYVLVRVHEAIENSEDIDVVERRVTEKGGSGGHNKIIKAGTEDADIALTCLRAGFGQRWTTTIMNASRRRRKMKELSRQAVQSAIVTMKIQCVKRTKQKTGSRDPASNWACAR
jgi:hypothetical protein